MKKQAFTLVELIVVITILAILATIGFVSFSGYLAGARDTNRIAQLKSMSDALELYRTKKDLPIPDDKVDVQASGTTIAYQGYIGANTLETIEYTEKGLDPKDKTYFSYYLTKNKKYFQLLSFLEEPSTDVLANNTNKNLTNSNLLNTTQAVNYSARVPHVKGKKLGILTDNENTPIQEITTITASGYLDIVTTAETYTASFSDNSILSGTGLKLAGLEGLAKLGGNLSQVRGSSCKNIMEKYGKLIDGIYTIDPSGNGSELEVYCDMTTDGGGWTFFGHMNSDSNGINFFEGGIGTYKSSREDDGTKYSLGVDDFIHTEMMVTLDNEDPIISDTANKIAFFEYTEGHLGFNKGPGPCEDLISGFQYKAQIGGSYISGGTTNNCTSTYWFPRTVGNAAYLVLFRGNSIYGNYWGTGIGGNNSWYHDGWWYLR